MDIGKMMNHQGPDPNFKWRILGPKIILVSGLVKFLHGVAYYFCLNLPATFSQPRASIISGSSEESEKWVKQMHSTLRHRSFGDEISYPQDQFFVARKMHMLAFG